MLQNIWKKWRIKIIFAVGAVIAVAAALWFFGGEQSATAKCPGPFTSDSGEYVIGDCTVYDASGKEVRFSDFSGKWLFLNFWGSWCPPCREEMPEMELVWQQRKDEGFVILAVSLPWRGETKELAKEFFDRHGFTYGFAFDSDDAITDLYDISSIPTTFLVSPDGVIQKVVVGARTWSSGGCRKLLDAFMRGQEITRGLDNGCR